MHTRIEGKQGVSYVDGEKIIRIPSTDACRRRLVELLERAAGDAFGPVAQEFWDKRVKCTLNPDEMEAAAAQELYLLLWEIWDELVPPPPVHEPEAGDLFDMFDL